MTILMAHAWRTKAAWGLPQLVVDVLPGAGPGRRGPAAPRPALVATKPNQVWPWDITYLPGPDVGRYWRLYVILDIYTPAVAGWLVPGRKRRG